MTQPTNPEPTADRAPIDWVPWLFLASFSLGIILAIIDINTRR